MQIKWLINGSYSLKTCYKPFGKGSHHTPPPHTPHPLGKIPVEYLKSLHGASCYSAQLVLPLKDCGQIVILSPMNSIFPRNLLIQTRSGFN